MAATTLLSCMQFHDNFQSAEATSTQAKHYVEGKAECVMELHSRRVLFASNSDIRLPMASTTKILTATTVLEESDNLSEKIVIPEEAAGITGSSVYLKSGDTYTVEELLYGLMLRSGNDCAMALALRFGGNLGGFSSKMNAVAQKAGALESNFVNPHGLPCNGHYTTAQDLSRITCYALHNPTFCEIVSTKYYQPKHWQNKNKMLKLFDGAIGVKTGYTKEAGRCLVSAATRNNMTLICSVLNCPTTYERSIVLLEDAFRAYSYVPLLSQETLFCLDDGKTKVNARSDRDFYYPLLEGEAQWIEEKTELVTSELKNKKSGEIIGKIEIYLAKRLLFSGNLYKL